MHATSQPRARALGAAIFGAAAGLTALGVWALLGRETGVLIWRAGACALAAGAVLGALAPDRLRRSGPLVTGALVGLTVHPVTWMLFVLWARLEAAEPAGTLFGDLSGALVWSAGSAAIGFVLTVPAAIAAAWVTRRCLAAPEPP